MVTCTACGQENPPESRFCNACGAELTAPDIAREERKVVTVVFADLVGFTARAEQMDPEEVRALLAPYHARLRSELELFGGTVEKFIGDAVMALFGAPVAHEDDPERAVRAALSIRDWAREHEDELQVRIAVNTGEALVALGARPDQGEAMASGDVVNTTSRLQSAAPVNGILVGETTWRATRHSIDYEEHEPVEAKGKTEPIAVWEAVEARARHGVDVTQESRAELVGRDEELGVLRDALSRAQREPSVQLVTLVGVPGIGKSRLVFELLELVRATPGLVTWRQGRSLPYGEGVSFWALGEMLKAQAGVLEADPPEVVAAKLDESVDALVDPAEAGWVKRHLGVLAGSTDDAEVSVNREEAYAAWRRYLEALAEQRPTVLVFEDLHWADEGLLDFVDHLIEWATDVPLLVLATARPELFTRRPGWGGGKRNAVTLSLSPLGDADTAKMIASLLGRSVLPAETQTALLERAEGNPLYAEQYSRMFAERGDVEDLPVPDNVQGIIAARLDALPISEKELVQNGAVLGKVFWTGALEIIGGKPAAEAERLLHMLDRKEFVRRERRPSVAGESEYAFRHVLVRDVAYSQIPRAARAEKHLRAADWIAALGRKADHAEMLAHHYVTALELERALGRENDVLVGKAREALRAAGDRARSLQAFVAAAKYYGDALDLAPLDAERHELLFLHALAVFRAHAENRRQILEQARDSLLEAEEVERAAGLEALLADDAWEGGEHALIWKHLERALELVADRPPSEAKARVLSQVARHRMLAAETAAALEVGTEALAMAETFGLDELRAETLITVGTGLAYEGQRRGIEKIKEGLQVSLASNSLHATMRAYHNLSATTWHNDLVESGRYSEEAGRAARRMGGDLAARYSDAMGVANQYWRGNWDKSRLLAADFMANSEAGYPPHGEDTVLEIRARMLHARGDDEQAAPELARAVSLALASRSPDNWVPVLVCAAKISLELGRRDEAERYVIDVLEDPSHTSLNMSTVELATLTTELGRADELRRLLEASPRSTLYHDATQAVLDGDHVRAADLLDQIGDVTEGAEMRLRAARAFAAGGRRAEADVQLQAALAFFRSVGATRYVREAEALLAEAS
jgi:class 3 adenylate cyclase/tetratricopeptide (TPR) repeat protein